MVRALRQSTADRRSPIEATQGARVPSRARLRPSGDIAARHLGSEAVTDHGPPWSSGKFDDLNAFRVDLVARLSRHGAALEYFRERASGGFRSVTTKPADHLSPSSTATAVRSLVEAGSWAADWGRDGGLIRHFLDPDLKTQGLAPGNIYTTAFALDAIGALLRVNDRPLTLATALEPDELAALNRMVETVEQSLANGYASIGSYPPSAYLTQMGVRVLAMFGALDADLEARVASWAWDELARQLALMVARSKTADFFQLAYCAVLAARLTRNEDATPDQRLLIDAAVNSLFAAQLQDGTWPRSQPIFDIAGIGSSYCYEYELLVELLGTPFLQENLIEHLDQLRLIYSNLVSTAYHLDGEADGWSSGHRQNIGGPEAWATASAYHFLHRLERLVVESIRRSTFEYLRTPYSQPPTPYDSHDVDPPVHFAPDLLDSEVPGYGSLKELVHRCLAEPIRQQSHMLGIGRSLTSDTPNTAILYGPPGTSKTELARILAEYLKWPKLTIDPSHFVRNGINHISAEADKVFAMLDALDRVVVLVDEIDELVQERTSATDPMSRFLTTSMLPKLVTLNKGKRILFIVATNHLERFDVAISRPGRFDLILPVGPPTFEEKLKNWPVLADKLGNTVRNDAKRREQLGALTYAETAALAKKLVDATGNAEAISALDEAHASCTFESTVEQGSKDPKGTEVKWEAIWGDQVKKSRIPA